jgi:hypothetical protein
MDDDRMLLLTIGYGNAQPEAFFAAVAEAHAYLALDVRLVPWGWHAAYRGEAMLAGLRGPGAASVARWSERLGNAAKTGGGEMRLADPAAVADLVSVLRMRRGPVLVVCGCRDASRCHRRMISDMAAALDPLIEVRDLATPAPAPRKPKAAAAPAAGAAAAEADMAEPAAEARDPGIGQ